MIKYVFLSILFQKICADTLIEDDIVYQISKLNTGKFWSNVVPYAMDDTAFSVENKEQVTLALQDINAQVSNVKFIPRTNEKDYLDFVNGAGCASYVGFVGGPQPVWLASKCRVKYVIQHEVMHAIGIFHEQSRKDRDDFITLHRENMLPGYDVNFAKQTNMIQATPYDKQSVMHYGRLLFSKNGMPTMTSNSDPVEELGGRVMTKYDILDIDAVFAPTPTPAPAPAPAPAPVVLKCAKHGKKGKGSVEQVYLFTRANQWFTSTRIGKKRKRISRLAMGVLENKFYVNQRDGQVVNITTTNSSQIDVFLNERRVGSFRREAPFPFSMKMFFLSKNSRQLVCGF
jgi:hypothetical protein